MPDLLFLTGVVGAQVAGKLFLPMEKFLGKGVGEACLPLAFERMHGSGCCGVARYQSWGNGSIVSGLAIAFFQIVRHAILVSIFNDDLRSESVDRESCACNSGRG